MTLQECYTALGGNYDDAISRLRSERLVTKFVVKFLDDDSCALLLRSMDEKNYEEAFRAAHTALPVSTRSPTASTRLCATVQPRRPPALWRR